MSELLEAMKKGMKDEISEMREQSTKSYQKIVPLIQSKQKDLKKIEDDINENYENIIKHIEIQPFKIIISKYDEKLDAVAGEMMLIKD